MDTYKKDKFSKKSADAIYDKLLPKIDELGFQECADAMTELSNQTVPISQTADEFKVVI